MVQPLDLLPETPSQTAGPYVHIGTVPNLLGNPGIYPADLGRDPFPGATDRITIVGRVLDGTGTALRDVLIETWQADGAGRHADDTTGWARFAADFETGEWRLDTVKPGPVPAPGGRMQAPHIAVWIVSRGINVGLATRIYFDDEDNTSDPLLARIELRHRVDTLIARREGDVYRFDIRLQGDGETVFLDI